MAIKVVIHCLIGNHGMLLMYVIVSIIVWLLECYGGWCVILMWIDMCVFDKCHLLWFVDYDGILHCLCEIQCVICGGLLGK